MKDPLGVVKAGLAAASVPEVARISGIPRRTVQGVLDGHVPSLTRAAKICQALGLELYIGPPRPYESVKQPPLSQIEVRPGGVVPVTDRRLMELLAALADHYEALNKAGRVALVEQMTHLFPCLWRGQGSGRVVVWREAAGGAIDGGATGAARHDRRSGG